MTRTITAQFSSRRDAERVVEHLVQEHNIDRDAVRIGAGSKAGIAGVAIAGADVELGSAGPAIDGSPTREGKVSVSARVDEAHAKAVTTTFAICNGSSGVR